VFEQVVVSAPDSHGVQNNYADVIVQRVRTRTVIEWNVSVGCAHTHSVSMLVHDRRCRRRRRSVPTKPTRVATIRMVTRTTPTRKSAMGSVSAAG
jgi:hypothetical protein